MPRYEVHEPLSPRESQETTLGSLLRHGAGTAATIGETLGNLPSGIAHGALGLARLGESASTALTKKLGVENLFDPGQKLPQSLPIPQFGTLAKEAVGKNLPSGYLEPQSEEAKKYQEFVSDVTSLITPLGALGGGLKIGKAAAVAGAGGLAKWAAQEIGAGPLGQTGAKLGTMVAATLLGPSQLKDRMSNLYKAADELVPENARVSSRNIEPALEKINEILKKGEITPSKKFMADRVASVSSKIKDGHIPVDEVLELKRNFNEYFGDLATPKGVQKYLPSLTNSFKKTLDEYGHKNKKFYQTWKEAEDIFQGMQPSLKVNTFLQKHVNPANIGKLTGGILLGYISPGVGAKLIGSGVATREGVKLFDMLKKSSSIRKFYGNVVASAAQKNTPQLLKNVGRLDKEITKEFPENVSGPSEQSARYLVFE